MNNNAQHIITASASGKMFIRECSCGWKSRSRILFQAERKTIKHLQPYTHVRNFGFSADPPLVVGEAKSAVSAIRKHGMFWHVHHSFLLEWCTSSDERIEYIARAKPEQERKTRYSLMRPAKGFPKELIVIARKYATTQRKIEKLEQQKTALYDKRGFKPWAEIEPKIGAVSDRLISLFRDRHNLENEFRAMIRRHSELIMRLHDVQCPKCPWTGTSPSRGTIFPRGYA